MCLNNVEFRAWNELGVLLAVQLTVYGDAGDVSHFDSFIPSGVQAFAFYIINIVMLVNIFTKRIPAVLAVIRICAVGIFSVYSNAFHGEAALSIICAVGFIIVIGYFNQQRIIALIAVCPDMIFLRMARSGSTLGSVYI